MTQPLERARIGKHDNKVARRRRVAATAMAVLFLAAAVVGCRTTPPPSVTSVTVDQADFGLQVGASSEPLTATVVVTGGASQDVVWSSAAPAVATVDEDSGVVTAVAVGTAEITATSVDDATKFDSVTVTVTAAGPVAVVSVSIDQTDFGLQVGASSAPLTATVAVTGGASQDVVWSSAAPAVATVDEDSGVVTAVAVGTAEITATSVLDDTKSDSVTVTVTTLPVTSISDLDAALALGSQVDLTWNAENATGFDVVCFDGVDERPIESLGGTATGTTIAIPASDCLEVRVYARGAGNDDDASVVLGENVVVSTDDAGAGSLRAIVASALPGSIIGFAADVTTVTLSTVQVIAPNDAHLILTSDVTISGPTAAPVTIQSDATLPNDSSDVAVNRSRVFFVPVGVTVQIDGLVVTGGTFIGTGAGVRNDGDLTITNSIFEGNRAWYWGGAIANSGTLRVEDSVLRDNLVQVTDSERTAVFACIGDVDRTCEPGDDEYLEFGTGGSGGALYNELGTATLVRTEISGNQAMFSGGGIYVGAGLVEVTDSDILDNVADDATVGFDTQSYGGGVQNMASFSMTGGSVEGNASEQDGGGVSNGSFDFGEANMTLTDVLVTLNDAGVYGGGAVNFYVTDVTNLSEAGTTSIVLNTAGNDGDDRFDIDVSLLLPLAPSSSGPTVLEMPQVPEGHLDR